MGFPEKWRVSRFYSVVIAIFALIGLAAQILGKLHLHQFTVILSNGAANLRTHQLIDPLRSKMNRLAYSQKIWYANCDFHQALYPFVNRFLVNPNFKEKSLFFYPITISRIKFYTAGTSPMLAKSSLKTGSENEGHIKKDCNFISIETNE